MLFIIIVSLIFFTLAVSVTLYPILLFSETMHTPNMMTYAQFVNQASSGDLVLFSSSHIPSLCIKMFAGTRFTHCGILYKNPTNGKLYVLSSTRRFKSFSKAGGAIHRGVSLISLNSIRRSYGNFYYRPIYDHDSDITPKLEEIYSNYKNIVYNDNILEFIATILKLYDMTADRKIQQKPMHCAEFVSFVYNRLGYISANDKLLPDSLSEYGDVQWNKQISSTTFYII